MPSATVRQIPSTECLLGSEHQAKRFKSSISLNTFVVACGGTAAQRGLNRVPEITHSWSMAEPHVTQVCLT